MIILLPSHTPENWKLRNPAFLKGEGWCLSLRQAFRFLIGIPLCFHFFQRLPTLGLLRQLRFCVQLGLGHLLDDGLTDLHIGDVVIGDDLFLDFLDEPGLRHLFSLGRNFVEFSGGGLLSIFVSCFLWNSSIKIKAILLLFHFLLPTEGLLGKRN